MLQQVFLLQSEVLHQALPACVYGAYGVIVTRVVLYMVKLMRRKVAVPDFFKYVHCYSSNAVNHFVINNFACLVGDIIHRLHPSHHIVCFKLFGYALILCKLFDQSAIHFLCSDVYLVKVGIQFAICQ